MSDKLKKTVKMTTIAKGDIFLSQILAHVCLMLSLDRYFSKFRKRQLKVLIFFTY